MNKTTYVALAGIVNTLTKILADTPRGRLEAQLAKAKRKVCDMGDRRDWRGCDDAEAEVERLEQELAQLE